MNLAHTQYPRPVRNCSIGKGFFQKFIAKFSWQNFGIIHYSQNPSHCCSFLKEAVFAAEPPAHLSMRISVFISMIVIPSCIAPTESLVFFIFTSEAEVCSSSFHNHHFFSSH